MARIIYPADFGAQQTLFYAIKAKNDADGINSVLTSFLAQQAIDLTADAANAADAADLDASAGLLSKQAENYTQLRNNAFNPVFTRLKAEVQFLKSFYKGNVNALGDWGITVTGDKRIVYPPSFDERLVVFTNFVAKHNSYVNGSSPLTPYLNQQSINLVNDSAAAVAAEENNTLSKQSAAESENSTQQRNLLWNPIMLHVKAIADFLKKLFNNNPKNLGLWGIKVDDSPQKPKLRTSKLLPEETITITSIVLGSVFTNTGNTSLQVSNNKNAKATPDTVLPGAQLGMLKGFSTITVTNVSTLENGKCTVVVSK